MFSPEEFSYLSENQKVDYLLSMNHRTLRLVEMMVDSLCNKIEELKNDNQKLREQSQNPLFKIYDN